MTQTRWVVLGLIVVVLVGGYFTYQHWKQEPPGWLLGIITRHPPAPELPPGDLAPLQAPKGFTASIYSRETPGARVLTRDSKGILIASLTSEGKVVALPDANNDGKADSTDTLIEGLTQPHGILFVCDTTCSLYVAETGTLSRYPYDPDKRMVGPKEELMNLPTGSGHFTRTLLMHPDGKRILIAAGSSCNVCKEADPHRAAITAYDIASGASTIYASGLRNSVFMAINYVTGAIWATENGRDVIGDDIPPDELNIIQEGKNYGWPICYGQSIYDADFDGATPEACTNATPATIDLQAHSAALGLSFIPEEGWPAEYRGDLLVAYHGSWNRSEPTGYKVVRFDVSPDGKSVTGGPYDFLTGFLPPNADDESEAIGRPVGLLAEPGGTVYVTDDYAGAVYRVSYSP